MISNCPECDASIKKAHEAGETWNLCAGGQCEEQSSYTHQFCNCTGQFSVYPYLQNGICMNGPGTLIPNAQYGCFCCCSCYFSGTSIATSKDAGKAAQDFNINDMVWVAADASLKTWIQKPVLFSLGTGANGQTKLLTIHFGDESTGVCVSSNLFVSKSVTQQEADDYYEILSVAPNNFIHKGGVVNKVMTRNANPDVIAKLLSVTSEVANSIYAILNSDPDYLLVTGNQPFLIKDGTLKQAEKLVPGKDLLVRQDGSTIPIISLKAGMFEQLIHYISTSVEKASSLDGHLLLANGIVIGDYATQMSMASKDGVINDNYINDPVLGSKEYIEANTHLSTDSLGARPKIE